MPKRHRDRYLGHRNHSRPRRQFPCQPPSPNRPKFHRGRLSLEPGSSIATKATTHGKGSEPPKALTLEAIREGAILAVDTPVEDTQAVIQADTRGEVRGEAILIPAVEVGPTEDVKTSKTIRECSRLCVRASR